MKVWFSLLGFSNANCGQLKIIMSVMFNKIKPLLVLGLITIVLESSKGARANNALISGTDECGKMASDDKIIFVPDVQLEEFPWIALLEYEDVDSNSTIFLCTGTLIGPRHVLTTASCDITQNSRGRKLISVRFGEWNLETSTDCAGKKLSVKQCSDPPVNIKVESSISHPGFKNGRDRLNRSHNDIALVKLAKDVEYSDFIRPICLPGLGDETKPNSTLQAITWGVTIDDFKMQEKQIVTMRAIENSNCHDIYINRRRNITNSQICAIGVDGVLSYGDGGGPLMNRFKENPQQWYVEGIVSFGPSHQAEGIPDVFTKVSSYLDWIHENVK